MIRIIQSGRFVGPRFKTVEEALDWGMSHLEDPWQLCDMWEKSK